MKAKNFLAVLVMLATLSAGRSFASMPEASVELAKMYVTYDYDKPSFIEANRVSHREYKSLNDRTITGELAAIRGREIYTQEQAEEEMAFMAERGLVPEYIFIRGHYTYDSNINAVCPTVNVSLRAQPNHRARIITELYGGEVQEIGYIAYCACSYLGEWTSPSGERWVCVEFIDSFIDRSVTSIGWLDAKYVRFITNDNIKEIARVIESIKGSASTAQLDTPTVYGVDGLETISAETLAKDFDNNPFKAERSYKGRTVKISGKIDSITMKNGSPAIQLSFSPKILCLVSRDDPFLTEIDKGGDITIEGTVSSLNAQSKSTEGITLTECKILAMAE
ncbi:MAG: hypothetical protein IJU31_05785 [Synergistaceae bacterium]|nr:hypothetical protein [Synergistaceae bacterium]